MNRIFCFLLALALGVSPAWANFTITTGTGTTVVAVDASNQGTSSCAAGSTECPATVLIDSTGTILSATSHVLNTNAAVTGTVTANAGTNLNTSALATDAHLTALTTVMGSPLQAGGNVAVTGTVLPSAISSCTAVNGSAITGTPTCQGVIVANTNPNITPGDATSTTVFGAASPIIGSQYLWNGTTYDRQAEAGATGLAAIGGGAAAGAAPAGNPLYSGALTGGATGGHVVGIIQSNASAPVNVSTATTTQLVALSSGRAIYVTAFDLVAAAADNVTFEYGTGTNCGTGTTALTGAYNFGANGGISKGIGLGPLLFVPSGEALCVLTSVATQLSGSVSYAQF